MEHHHKTPIHPFTSSVGPAQHTSSPLEVFHLIFSPDLLVKESNAYAKIKDNSGQVEGVFGINGHKLSFVSQ